MKVAKITIKNPAKGSLRTRESRRLAYKFKIEFCKFYNSTLEYTGRPSDIVLRCDLREKFRAYCSARGSFPRLISDPKLTTSIGKQLASFGVKVKRLCTLQGHTEYGYAGLRYKGDVKNRSLDVPIGKTRSTDEGSSNPQTTSKPSSPHLLAFPSPYQPIPSDTVNGTHSHPHISSPQPSPAFPDTSSSTLYLPIDTSLPSLTSFPVLSASDLYYMNQYLFPGASIHFFPYARLTHSDAPPTNPLYPDSPPHPFPFSPTFPLSPNHTYSYPCDVPSPCFPCIYPPCTPSPPPPPPPCVPCFSPPCSPSPPPPPPLSPSTSGMLHTPPSSPLPHHDSPSLLSSPAEQTTSPFSQLSPLVPPTPIAHLPTLPQPHTRISLL